MTSDFGHAVRVWRQRVTPESAGLPAGGRRRSPGLRREELGMLAGVSVDYVVRLEQGRSTAPSAQVVEALARALRLDPAEREHLFRLAALRPTAPGLVPVALTPGVRRMMERMAGTPVGVYDAAWTLITANPLWTALLGDPGPERNMAWRHFVVGDSRVRYSPEQWQYFGDALVTDLRAAAATYPDDPGVRQLIDRLRASGSRFAEYWEAGRFAAQRSSRKTVDHPVVGSLTLDCDVLTVPGADLKIIAYTAEPGTPDADRLALLDPASGEPASSQRAAATGR